MTQDENQSETSPTTQGASKNWRRKLLSYFWIGLAIYAGICLLLTIFQRGLIYLPTCQTRIPHESAGLESSRVETITFKSDQTGVEIRGWQVRAAVEQNADKKWATLIFCGNGHHRGGRGETISLFNQLGADVFIFDYQGYGETGGSPSETNNISDAKQIWSLVTGEYGFSPQHVILFGESLGGGVATQVAEHACQKNEVPAALVIRSSFSSLVDAAANHYSWLPVRWLLFDRYLSSKSIQQVTCPLLQFHGDHDQIVPMELGQKLFEQAPKTSTNGIEKQFVLLEGTGHNNVPQSIRSEFGAKLKSFVARLGL